MQGERIVIRAPLHNLRVSWKPVRKAVTQSLLPHLRACGLFRIVRLQMLGSLSLLSASCIILTAESYMSVSFTPLTPLTPSLHCTALHFISLHFTYSLSLSHSLALSFRARHQGACEEESGKKEERGPEFIKKHRLFESRKPRRRGGCSSLFDPRLEGPSTSLDPRAGSDEGLGWTLRASGWRTNLVSSKLWQSNIKSNNSRPEHLARLNESF